MKFQQIERMRLNVHSAMANAHYRYNSPERIVMKPIHIQPIYVPETMKKYHLHTSLRGVSNG